MSCDTDIKVKMTEVEIMTLRLNFRQDGDFKPGWAQRMIRRAIDELPRQRPIRKVESADHPGERAG